MSEAVLRSMMYSFDIIERNYFWLTCLVQAAHFAVGADFWRIASL